MRHYGIGPLTSITILAELGDARRFNSSREAVRFAGLDVTVHQSDACRAAGRLSREGPNAIATQIVALHLDVLEIARRVADVEGRGRHRSRSN
jgi:transposase